MDDVRTDLVEIMSLVKGNVERELLLRNEYLAAENEILRSRVGGRLLLARHEKARLARLGREIGVHGLKGLSYIVTPETVMRWYRELIAQKFDGSAKRRKPRGLRRVSAEKERLVCRLALDNVTWGYTRIRGAMKNVGHEIGRSTIRRILKRNGIPPAPRRARNSNWREFISRHMHNTVAADFFTVEVVTPYALVTFYVLFFVHHATRRVLIAGVTTNPDTPWMMQIARNITMEGTGFLNGMKYLIHDRDSKFCPAFDHLIESAGVDLVPLAAPTPRREEGSGLALVVGEADLHGTGVVVRFRTRGGSRRASIWEVPDHLQPGGDHVPFSDASSHHAVCRHLTSRRGGNEGAR